jgi:hypothetical protein
MKPKTKQIMRSIQVASTAILFIALACVCRAELTWERITIPIAPAGAELGPLWERNPHDLYVWGHPTNSTPSATLYQWNGTNWSISLSVTGQWPAAVFGVGTGEVFAAAETNLWRSTNNGISWSLQATPLPAGSTFGKISGTSSNVHVVSGGGYIYRYDGVSWTAVFNRSDFPPYTLHVSDKNEGYFVTCLGWGTWSGTSWNAFDQGFDFCDVYDTFAMRDAGGQLHWWAVGNNNFANGIRVWCFNTANMSFGCKNCYCFGDGNNQFIGSAYGIWGSATNDVYVIGDLASVANGTRAGRVYHFDGNM